MIFLVSYSIDDKNVRISAGEMTHDLRMLVGFAEDSSSVPCSLAGYFVFLTWKFKYIYIYISFTTIVWNITTSSDVDFVLSCMELGSHLQRS